MNRFKGSVGFDVEFFSSDGPGFGGGEFADNVFDNSVGGGNNKSGTLTVQNRVF